MYSWSFSSARISVDQRQLVFLFPTQIREDKPLPFQLIFVAEVDKVTDCLPGDPHVIEQLSFVFRGELADRLELLRQWLREQAGPVCSGSTVRGPYTPVSTHAWTRTGSRGWKVRFPDSADTTSSAIP